LSRVWRSYWPALVLFGLGFVALTVDIPVAWVGKDRTLPSAVFQLVDSSEAYGHGIGVALLLTAIYLLDPQRRRCIPRIAVMSLGSGLINNLVKKLIQRSRPVAFDFAGGVFDTFKQWDPLSWHPTGMQSCPSSHTATAMGLTLGLTWLYPRGRWLFVAVTVMVASQRVLNIAHFLSDTLWGATVGWLIAVSALRGVGLFRYFDRWEAGAQQRDSGESRNDGAETEADIITEKRRAA